MENVKRKIATLRMEMEKSKEMADALEQEVEEANEKADEAERHVGVNQTTLSELEDEYDEVLERCETAKLELEAVEAERDEKDRDLRKYMNSEQSNASTLEQQNYELKEVQDIAEQAGSKYSDACKKLAQVEDELATAEEAVEELKTQIKEYEELLHGANTDLKSLQATKTKLSDKDEQGKMKIEHLQLQIEETDREREKKQQEADVLAKDIDVLDEEMEKATTRFSEISEELETALAELNEM